MYSIQALWSAAHHDLGVVFVIIDNREYRILKHNMDAYRQRFGVRGRPPLRPDGPDQAGAGLRRDRPGHGRGRDASHAPRGPARRFRGRLSRLAARICSTWWSRAAGNRHDRRGEGEHPGIRQIRDIWRVDFTKCHRAWPRKGDRISLRTPCQRNRPAPLLNSAPRRFSRPSQQILEQRRRQRRDIAESGTRLGPVGRERVLPRSPLRGAVNAEGS